MARPKSTTNLFSFDDYRLFLRRWYEEMKQTRSALTYRSFAAKAGFQTSNFLMLVIQGKRNLTEDSLAKVVKGLELNKHEATFFRSLVFFNQAKTTEEKQRYYDHLIQTKRFQEAKPIERQQYEYYAKWYHPVIRELIASPTFDGTSDWLAHRLNPQVTRSQCAKSMELLQSLGLILQTRSGRWEQTDSLVSSGEGLRSLIVHNYHKSILELARTMMDRLSAKERETSTMTIGVSKAQLQEIRERIAAFRQDILRIASGNTAPEEVAQLSIQFFPLTKTE